MGRGGANTLLIDPPPYSNLNGGAAGGGGGAGTPGGSDMFNIAGDGGAGVLPSFGGLLNDIYGQVLSTCIHLLSIHPNQHTLSTHPLTINTTTYDTLSRCISAAGEGEAPATPRPPRPRGWAGRAGVGRAPLPTASPVYPPRLRREEEVEAAA